METVHKRCNSNDRNSNPEIVPGELRAKFLRRRQGLAGQRVDAPHISDQAPPAWRAPEGPKGLAAVLVGGGGAWPGFEATRRAKLAARTARGRAAAHGHIKQPGPTRQATRRPEHQRRHKQRKRAAAHQGRRAFTQLDQTLNTVESANTQHNRERKHSAQSRARVLSAVAGPPPRRPGPR